MKLSAILNCWQQPTHEDPTIRPGDKVYARIPKFARRVELMNRVEKMRKICIMYAQEEQSKIRELIQAYCDEQNEKNAENKEWVKLEVGKNIGSVKKAGKWQEYIDWQAERVVEEIEVPALKFSPEELEVADLSGDELMMMKAFYDEKELVKYIKSK